MPRHRDLPLFAAALAGLVLAAPAHAADVGDPDVLREEPGVELDDPVNTGAPDPALPEPPEAETSTTIDVDVGESPEYEVTVEDDDDIPDVGGASGDVDVGVIEDPGLGTAEEIGAPRMDIPTDQSADVLDTPSDLRDDPTGIGDSDVGSASDFEITEPDTDPIAPDVDVGDDDGTILD